MQITAASKTAALGRWAIILGTLLAVDGISAQDGEEALVFETNAIRLEIGRDGTLHRLSSKPEDIEYFVTEPPCPVAVVYRGGRMVPSAEGKYAAVTSRWVYQGGSQFAASGASLQGDLLTLEFGPAHVTATCRVRGTGDYLAFELLAVEGEPVDRIEFLRLNVRRLPMLGQWLGAAWDDQNGLCLCAGNPTELQRRLLADRREHHLFVDEEGHYELVEIEAVPEVAQGAVKAFLFHHEANPEDTYVVAWATEGRLRLRLPSRRLVAMRPLGTRLSCEHRDDATEVPIGPRTYLVLPGVERGEARELLRGAQVVH